MNLWNQMYPMNETDSRKKSWHMASQGLCICEASLLQSDTVTEVTVCIEDMHISICDKPLL